MQFISPNGDYPLYFGDIERLEPDYTYGDPIPEGWTTVNNTEPPELEKYQKLAEGGPVEIDGEFYQSWDIVEMTDEERARVDAPETAKAKLLDLGLTELEIKAIVRGLI